MNRLPLFLALLVIFFVALGLGVMPAVAGTDVTPPATIDDSDGLWHNTSFTITLTATDTESGMSGGLAKTEYKVDAVALLSAPVLYGTGAGPYVVAVGDFNGDGKQDLVTGNAGVNTANVLLGDGSGAFGAKAAFATGANPASVAIADFNGDGKQDLVTGNYESYTVSVLLGNGSGGFGPKTDFATGTYPISIAVGDFNGDGKPDLATANAGADTVSVLLGNGSGGLGPKTDFATGTNPLSVTVGDFNGDGKPDLVTANGGAGAGNTVSVLLGNGSGGFGAKTDFATGTSPCSIAVGDFNGDGKPDLVTANSSANTVSVLLGNGSGGFGAKTDFATGTSPCSIAVGDLNGDGKPDLATANYFANTASVLLGDGSGVFDAKADFATGVTPRQVAVGDFNADGFPDLVTANCGAGAGNTVSVLLGLGMGTVWQTGTSVLVPAPADHSNDGLHTIAYCSTDAAGNTEAPEKTCTVKIDTIAPSTTDDAPTGWSNAAVTVTLTPVDTGSGVSGGAAKTEYNIDSTSWQTGTSVLVPAPADHSNDGLHTITYRSTDAAGNTEIPEKTCTVRIDANETTAPSTTDDAPTGWSNGAVTVTLTPVDTGSGMSGGAAKTEYNIDSASWQTGTSVLVPAPADHSNDGLHTITYRSTDFDGNVETPEKTCTVRIDTRPPASGVLRSPQTWADPKAYIHFTGSNPNPGDHASFWTYRNLCSVFIWDREPVPDSYLHYGDSGLAGIQYKLDGAADWTLVDPLSWPPPTVVTGVGRHQLTYRAVDNAGNAEPERTWTVTIVVRKSVRLAISAKPSVVGYAGSSRLSGALKDSAGRLIHNRIVRLERLSGGSWSLVRRLASSTGRYSTSVSLTSNSSFRLTFAGDRTYKSGASGGRRVYAHARLTPPAVPSLVHSSFSQLFYTSYGTLRPQHNGGDHSVVVRWYALVGGVWRLEHTDRPTNVDYNGYTRYKVTYGFMPVIGTGSQPWKVQATHSDSSHVLTKSAWRYFKVH